MRNLPFVSVIVPMFNAENTIAKCLSSIKEMDYPHSKMQIIIVDNLSNDNSESIVKSIGVDKYLKTEGNISAVRNYGANSADGDILAFVDSDCLVSNDWINEAINGLIDDSVGAVGSGYSIPGKGTWVEKAWLAEYDGPPKKINFVPSGNFAVKRNIFDDIGGFNESLQTGEDSDICIRIRSMGKVVMMIPRMINIHLGNSKTIKEFLKKESWYGINMVNIALKNGLNKVIIMTTIFILFEICAVVLMVCGMIFEEWYFLFLVFFIVGILSILIASSFYRVQRTKKFNKCVQIAFLYFCYYNARGYAIIRSLIEAKNY